MQIPLEFQLMIYLINNYSIHLNSNPYTVKRILLISLLFIFSKQASAQILRKCEREVAYGSATICLPFIESMKECFTNDTVNALALSTEYPGNIVLGYYLMDSTYARLNQLDSIEMGNFIKVYANEKLKDYKADNEVLKQICEATEASLKPAEWKNIKETVEEIVDSISVGTPKLVDEYSNLANTKSYILIVKYATETSSFVSVMALDIVLVQERILCLAYYADYTGKESQQKMKQLNDKILKAFVEINR